MDDESAAVTNELKRRENRRDKEKEKQQDGVRKHKSKDGDDDAGCVDEHVGKWKEQHMQIAFQRALAQTWMMGCLVFRAQVSSIEINSCCVQLVVFCKFQISSVLREC